MTFADTPDRALTRHPRTVLQSTFLLL